MSITHKEQLAAFFNIYSKNNVGREDEMLSKRPGKEEAFFEQLEQKANCKFFSCVKELLEHYTKTDPSKIKTILPAFMKFPKRELDVVAKIKGSAPAATPKAAPAAAAPAATPTGGGGDGGIRASSDHKKSLIALMTTYNEGLIPKIDGLLTQHAGKEAALLKALDNKLCPQKNFFDTRDKIYAIFQKHKPDSIDSVEKLIVGKLKGGATATEQLLGAIVKKYGDAEVGTAAPSQAASKPPTPASATAAAAPPAGASKPSSDWKVRLTAFLTDKKDPRAAKVDAILTQYAGKEPQVFKSLVEKLGPEEYWISRLTRHFKQHKPALVEQVDKLLKQHAGNEDKLIESLVKKFGPEPAAPAASASPAAPAAAASSGGTPEVDNMTWSAKVSRFYFYHSPAKLANADALLKKEAGREKELYAALVKRAGSDPTPKGPPAVSDFKARLVNLLAMAQPQALGNTDAYLAKYKDNEEKLIQGLVAKHKVEEPCKAATGGGSAGRAASPPSWKDRFTAFFEKYNPDNIPKIDGILQKYKDNLPGLMESLVKKYGPEPAASSAPQLSYRERVEAIYAKYNPDKKHQVDTVMSQYAGREATLINQLVAKYGPEPAPPGQLTLKERLVRMYMKYNPEKVSTVPGLIAKYGEGAEELMQKLVEKYGPEPNDDEEEDERTKQQRLDSMEWSKLTGPLKVVHESERAGRWEVEDNFTSALEDISMSMKKGEAYVEKIIVANNLADQNECFHRTTAYKRWFAAFKERIRLEKKRHRELLDQRMSVYDQLQTNGDSIKYYERQARKKAHEKEKRQSRFKAGIQPKAEPTKKRYEKDFVGYNMRMASCSPAQRSASVLSMSRSRSRSVGKMNAPETISPAVLSKVLTYQKKWLPKAIDPPEYPSRCFEPDSIPKRFSRRPVDRNSVSLQSIVGTGETAVERAIREMREHSIQRGRADQRSKSSDFPQNRSPSGDSVKDYFPASRTPARLPVY